MHNQSHQVDNIPASASYASTQLNNSPFSFTLNLDFSPLHKTFILYQNPKLSSGEKLDMVISIDYNRITIAKETMA
jgi:hypothetical protein